MSPGSRCGALAVMCGVIGATTAQSNLCSSEAGALITSAAEAASVRCAAYEALQRCVSGIAAGPTRTALDNTLVAFGASYSKDCSETAEPPSITTNDGVLQISAEELTLERRSRATISLFEMYDQLQNVNSELSTGRVDREAAISTQKAQDAEQVSLVASTVSGILEPYLKQASANNAEITSMVDTVAAVSSAVAAGAASGVLPCQPGIEYQAGTDDQGRPVCRYISPRCAAGTWEKTRVSRTNDRKCVVWTVCDFPKEWLRTQGTPDADSVCAKTTTVEECEAKEMVSTEPPTPTSDRVCSKTPGLVKDSPASSCTEIKVKCPDCDSAEYWVRNGNGETRKVYCEQKRYGGGFMRIGHQRTNDYYGCWRSTGDCNVNRAPKGHATGTWKYGDSFINGFNYDVLWQDYYELRGSAQRARQGGLAVWWRGKAVGGCQLKWDSVTVHGNGQCDCSFMNFLNPSLDTLPGSGRCCGRHHSCHRGLGDWPCHGGEATLNHCHDGGHTYLTGNRQGTSQSDSNGRTNMDVWLRVKK